MTQESKKKKNRGIYIIIVAFVVMTIVTLCTGTTKVQWSESLDKSFQLATENGKPLFVVFLTKIGDDASVCQRLAYGTLTNPDIARYLNKKYNPVSLDRDANSKEAAKYGVKKLPAMVIITPNDKENIRLEGFISEDEFLARIGGAMKQLKSKSGVNGGGENSK